MTTPPMTDQELIEAMKEALAYQGSIPTIKHKLFCKALNRFEGILNENTRTLSGGQGKDEAVEFSKWLQHTDNGTEHYNPFTKDKSESIGFSPYDCFVDKIYTVEELHAKWQAINCINTAQPAPSVEEIVEALALTEGLIHVTYNHARPYEVESTLNIEVLRTALTNILTPKK